MTLGLAAAVRRWRDIVTYAIAAALAAIPLGVVISHTVERLYAPALEISASLNVVLWWTTCAVLLLLAWRHSGTRIRHFQHLLWYPPTVVAVPFGLWLLAATIGILTGEDHQESVAWPFVVLAAGTTGLMLAATCAAALVHWRDRQQQTGRPVRKRAEILSLPFEQLRQWLSAEAPIKDFGQDLFRAHERAIRVFDALKTPRHNGSGRETRQTAVVQGPFGAGKSSIIHLVEKFAHSDPAERHIFAHVSCWGFSSISAQEHVLEGAVAALSQHVDCLAVRGVPAAYADALAETSSWVGTMFRALSRSRTPVGQLQRFTPILRAIQARLVIVLEDTDRNGPDFDQKHIEAMLYNFRDVDRISFVLTAGAKSDIDFPKIAEHILFLPPIPEATILELLDHVREHCQSSCAHIDPTPTEGAPRNRPTSLRASASTAHLASQMFRYEHPDWAIAVASLLNTPRRLKQTLSGILTSWETLRGEVDLDELIMLTALRNCAPGVFTFFGMHLTEFEHFKAAEQGNHGLSDDRERLKNRLEDLKADWKRIANDSGYDSRRLGALLGELVWSSTYVTDVKVYSVGNRCQSIRSSRGPVYWERLTTDSIAENDVRDQEVLAVMQNATNTNGAATLGKRFSESAEFAELVVFFDQFSHRINDDTLFSVASVAVRHMRPLDIGSWNREPGSFGSLKRWLDRVTFPEERLRDWLAEEMVECLPHGLRDANALYFDIARSQLSGEAQVNVRQRFIAAVKECFAKLSAADFAALFDRDYPYSLGHLMRLDRKDYPPAFLASGADWQWLAPLLLDAMKQHPEVVIPQVLMAFGNSGPGGTMPTWFKYDEELLKVVFGERVSEAVSLLAQDIAIAPTAEDWFKLVAPLATAAAKELLSRLESSCLPSAPIV